MVVHCWLRIPLRGGTEFASGCLVMDNHCLRWGCHPIGQYVNTFDEGADKIAESNLCPNAGIPVYPEKISKQKRRLSLARSRRNCLH